MGSRNIYNADDLSNITLSKMHPEATPSTGTIGRPYIPDTGKGVEISHCPILS